MRPEIWIVITGEVRNLFELAYSLHIASAARRRGLVTGVVLSTWLGEREKAPDIFSAAENDGVFLIESLSPREWASLPPHRSSPLYQTLTLHRALEVIPDDSFILKTRTDFIPDYMLFFLNIIEHSQSIGRDALLDKSKITVLHINNVLFFDICDTQFFANCQKLRQPLEFSAFADTAANQKSWYFVPETRIFGQKYLRSCRSLSFLCSVIEIEKFIELPQFLLSSRVTAWPSILIEAFAAYYAYLLQDFQLVFQGTPAQGRFRLGDLFTPHGRLCEEAYRPGCAFIRFDAKLRSLVGAIADGGDQDAERFLSSLTGRLHAAPGEFAERLGSADIEELIALDAELPEERRFLALPPDAIRARSPRPRRQRDFDLCAVLALLHYEFGPVFIRQIEEGRMIESAAYETFVAASRPGFERSSEAQFWLDLAAHYGNRAAQEQVGFPPLDFSSLRQRREAWLDRLFSKAAGRA